MDLVTLLIYIAVAAIIIVAAYAILSKVPMDPAVRNIVTIAIIAVVAIFAVIILLQMRHSGSLVP